MEAALANNRRNELWVGVLLAVALAVLGWLSLQVGAISGVGPTIDVVLRMKDAAGISAGATVSIAGVQVGRVEEMKLDRDTAVAMLRLDAEKAIPRDVRARIRARSVLGEKYLELVPTSKEGGALQDGDVLEISAEQIEIDEMVSTAGTLLNAVDVDALAAGIKAVTDALREDPQRMERAFDHVDTILDNTAKASEGFPGLMERANGSLDRADRLMDTLQARAQEAKSPLARGDKLLADLQEAAKPLPDAVREGREAIAKASSALDKASSTLDSAKKLIGDFDGIDKDIKTILANFSEIDKWELRRLLREEGILIRLKPDEVVTSPSRSKDVVPKSGEHNP